MVELKYMSGRRSASWSQAPKWWGGIGWMLNFQGLGSNSRPQQTSKGISRWILSSKLWHHHQKVVDFSQRGTWLKEKKIPMDQRGSLAEVFCCRWDCLFDEGRCSRLLSVGSGLRLTSSCPGWLNGCVTYVVTHGPVLRRASFLV